jgi:S1-C subfamily serine protease
LFRVPLRAALVLAVAGGQALAADGVDTGAWRETLERIGSAVVSIQVDSPRAFDTEWNESSQATGFVVDAAKGLILTNRHVVTAGPVRAVALFLNQEEVELQPVYRDPVHDFGFYRYDPAALRYIRPVELPLVPQAAQVGREIRIVGNDGGEQLSILSGTIARLRRDAPEYGRGKYNDFNTFYLQAASGTSGGSSGSPVIDRRGRVVALNAGASNQAASSFFLPLDRVTRALELLREGRPVTRGTVGTVCRYTAFDELRRLGLSEATEASVRRRFPDATGMLVVSEVLPGTSGDGALRVGDILVRVAGEFLTEFVPMETILDLAVGRTVQYDVERGGQSLQVPVVVQDLNQLSPAEFLQFGDAVVHDLSYQQARHFNREAAGVFVANPGFVLASAGIPRSSVIVTMNGDEVRSLDDLEMALAGLGDQQRSRIRYVTRDEPASSRLSVMRMDRRWFMSARCRRDDTQGLWPCRELAPGPGNAPPDGATIRLPRYEDAQLRRLSPSLVLVRFDMPYTISGVSEQHYYGTGLIVDAERGYVAVDRNTVPEAMGDARITFGGSLEVPATVEYLHPMHNLALLRYDTALIGDTPVVAARLAQQAAEPGTEVWVVGMRNGEKLATQRSTIASLEPVEYPLSRTMRFRDANLETLSLVNAPADMDGVLVQRDGTVLGLWSSFAWQGGGELSQENRGMPIEYVREMTDLVVSRRALHSIEVEWSPLPLADARRLGLSVEWAGRIAEHDPERRQVLSVARTVAGSPADSLLEPGDLLLAIDGVAATRFRDVELRTQRASVSLDLLRNGQPISLELDTVPLDGSGTRRALMWAGALLQAPYRDIAMQRGVEPTGVYVSYFAFGSPASRYGLFAGRRIVELDGQPVPDLDGFIKLVTGMRNRQPVRLTTVTWTGQPEVLTLKLDEFYWPAYQISWESADWRRKPLQPHSPD